MAIRTWLVIRSWCAVKASLVCTPLWHNSKILNLGDLSCCQYWRTKNVQYLHQVVNGGQILPLIELRQRANLDGPSEARIEGEVFVRPGYSIALTCSADSNPPPEFQWKVNDTDTGAKTSKYRVSNAKTEHQGLYTCVVRNPATLRTATAAVYVNVTAEFVPPGADLPMIIGVTVATVLLLILIAAVTYLFIIHKRRKSSSDTSSMMKGSSRNGQADNATQAMEEHELQYTAIQFSNSTPRKPQKPETIYENRRPQPPPPSDNVVYSDLKLR
ncbi:carcinoembryonic antigen-related cell adhesion molecule 20-like [Bufo gargarizans]|uniref:carcinoembryonic antigen-related cell adhesion molecule 20-like n=1 Tax=Bufo gargarizans TaxID=30331 RepID=UPI001CF38B5B|nr:carcinoembryonic antigen-related cell adhesion molecule 20-like [Bufo gargarizans]